MNGRQGTFKKQRKQSASDTRLLFLQDFFLRFFRVWNFRSFQTIHVRSFQLIPAIMSERSQSRPLSTLTKLFTKFRLVDPPGNSQQSRDLQTRSHDPFDEEFLASRRNRSKRQNEERVNQTLRDWVSDVPLSVGVTGGSGIGKSKLIKAESRLQPGTRPTGLGKTFHFWPAPLNSLN